MRCTGFFHTKMSMRPERTRDNRIGRPLALFVAGMMTALALLCWFWEAHALFGFFLSLTLAIFAYALKPRAKAFGCAALALFGMSFSCALWIVYGAYIYKPAVSCANRAGVYEGYVVDRPEVYEDYTRLVVRLDSRDGAAIPAVRLRLYLDGDFGALLPGDRLRFSAQPELPEDSPYFDTARYLKAHRIFLRADAEEAQIVETDKMPFTARLKRMAYGIGDALTAVMPEREAGLMRALLFGDETGLDEGYVRDLRISGLSHITAVSGMNVAFLVGIILTIFRRKYGTIPALAAVVFFVIMTGAPASVVRAGIMQTLYLISFGLRRETDTVTSLSAAAGIILLCNPYSIADLGFLLSFFATLGILCCGAPVNAALRERVKPKNRFVRHGLYGMFSVLTTTLSAQLFILPLQVLFFGELSLVAPLSNLLVLWASEYAFTFGAFAALAALVWPAAGIVIGAVPRALCTFILWIVPRLAALPFASISAKGGYIGAFLIFALCAGLIVLFFKKANRAFAALCGVLVFFLSFVFSAAESRRCVSMSVVSTGAGQSAVLCCGGRAAVFNCGGRNAYTLSGLTGVLEENGVRRLEVLVLSSYRSADCANVQTLLKTYPADRLCLPVPADDDQRAVYEDLCALAEACGAAVETLDTDRHIESEAWMLDIYVNQSEDPDAGRLVMLAECAHTRLLALGALRSENLGRLLTEKGVRQAQLIALGDGFSQGWPPGALRRLHADYAVASPYGEADSAQAWAFSRGGTQLVSAGRLGSFTLRVPT